MRKYFFISLIGVMVNAAANSPAGATVPYFNKIKIRPERRQLPESHPDQDGGELLNKPAPVFELKGLDSKIYSLRALKGKIVVLNFWFISCKPCVNEMPVLNSIKDSQDQAKVVFLALSLDNKDAIYTFLQNHEFNYTILPSAAQVHKKYNLNAYPTSIVINARGIVSFVQIGGPDIGKNLSAAINAALKSPN